MIQAIITELRHKRVPLMNRHYMTLQLTHAEVYSRKYLNISALNDRWRVKLGWRRLCS